MTFTLLSPTAGPLPRRRDGLPATSGDGNVCWNWRGVCRILSGRHTIRFVSSESEYRVQHIGGDEDTGLFEIEILYKNDEAGWRVVGLHVAARPDLGGFSIDSSALRRIEFGEMFRLDHQRFTDAEAVSRDPWSYLPEEVRELIRSRLVELVEIHGPSPGPRSHPFQHYAELAAQYEAAARAALTPTVQVATWAGVSKAAAEKQILRARHLGFLPPPQVGRQMSWQEHELKLLYPAARAWWEQNQREKKAEEEQLREEQGE